jgi:hypothetical protein
MDPSAPYWQYGFPAAIICVFGADFAFACGTLFIAKIAHPHEQSVAGAIFQTIMALGTSVGLSITTIAEVAGMKSEARKLGITLASDATAAQLPPAVLLKGYRAAQLAGVGFGVCGKWNLIVTATRQSVDMTYKGLLIIIVFLHGIGIVGTKQKKSQSTTAESSSEEDEKVADSPA